jgi:hypothetical protein
MPLLYGTYLGGLTAHLITVIPWVCGGIFSLMPIALLFTGRPKLGAVLLGTLSVQYMVKIKKWEAFRRW